MTIQLSQLLQSSPLSAKITVVMCVILFTACSIAPTAPLSPLQECEQRVEDLQARISKAGVRDAQKMAIDGFSVYRSDRFWSSFAAQPLNEEQERYWRQQLHQMGMASLRLEWQNLPLKEIELFDQFEQQCSQLLFEASLQQPLSEKALTVPDSYSDTQRFLGVYALVKYGAAGSIADYQQEMQRSINQFKWSDHNKVNTYHPNSNTTLQEWSGVLQEAYRQNPLSVPDLSMADLTSLAKHHAPHLRVEQKSAADLVGKAIWVGEQRQIDSSDPVVYFNHTYIRYRDEILLQLNYSVWFPERPKPTRFDWYGGKLDGLVWRVTLNRDGSVLMYDSIHPCGCYHTVHLPPSSTLLSTLQAPKEQEPLEPILYFETAVPERGGPVMLGVAADTHYLLRVAPLGEAPSTDRSEKGVVSIGYQLQPYDLLRSLPAQTRTENGAENRRSWFDHDGLIGSSARFERFFLWPLGVPSAGAMRQQGHHAIAFVGKRHFDEPSVEALLGL